VEAILPPPPLPPHHAAALVAGLTDAPTPSNANIELERKAIGNVSRAMHLSDEDEEDDDGGDAAHQAGDSLLYRKHAW
jgi:hypothetical protein